MREEAIGCAKGMQLRAVGYGRVCAIGDVAAAVGSAVVVDVITLPVVVDAAAAYRPHSCSFYRRVCVIID